MNLGKEKRQLTKDEIFSMIHPYDVYRYYLGYNIEPGKVYLSPFRKDNNPSFGIFVTREGALLYNDFGSGMCGDCISLVMHLCNVSFYGALVKIDSDFGLGIRGKRGSTDITSTYIRPALEQKKKTLIQITARSFTSDDLAYWGLYGLGIDDLRANNVYSVDKLYVDKKMVKRGLNSLLFAYLFVDGTEEYLKIYSPLDRDYKWISNVPVRIPLGLDKLEGKSNIVIVTKSKKDKMVLNKLISDVYEAQKEGTEVISAELDEYFNQHYDKKICFFDNDEPGKRANKSLNPKGYGWINVPNKYSLEGIKDPSDLVRYYGYDTLERLLRSKKVIV